MSQRNRESAIHQARVYLAQARATKHEGWRATLIAWAGKCRREAMVPVLPQAVPVPAQGDLFEAYA